LVKVWELGANEAPARVLRGHEGDVYGVGFLADSRTLVSCGRDQSVRFWDLRKAVASDGIWSLPPSTGFATIRQGHLIAELPGWRYKVWDVSQIPQSLEPRIISLPPSLRDAAFIPLPGREYVLGFTKARPSILLLYRGLQQPETVQDFPQIGIFGRSGFQFSKRHLFIHGVVRGVPHLLVWNIAEERQVHLIRTTLSPVSAMTIAPDESLVLLGDIEGALECVNLVSESSELWGSALPGSVSALAILPDNRTLLAASAGILRKIDWPTRRSDQVPGGLREITTMSVSSTRNRLATGDAQGVVRLWDVETLREVAVLGMHPGFVTGVHFQPDGRTLLSVDTKELRVWRAGGP
jgi:WD40 repeat protein